MPCLAPASKVGLGQHLLRAVLFIYAAGWCVGEHPHHILHERPYVAHLSRGVARGLQLDVRAGCCHCKDGSSQGSGSS